MRQVLLFILCLGCTSPALSGGPGESVECELPAELGPSVVFTDIHVVNTLLGTVAFDRTVLIEGDRIVAVGTRASIKIPEAAQVVEGCGRYLAPGLADMHVHIRDADLPSYLSSGITTVRNMWGYPALKPLIAGVDNGTIDGPTIYAVSPGLDGLPEKWPFTQLVLRPEDAAEVVQTQVDDGWGSLKLYADLSREAYDAIIVEAISHGLGYGGHVPHRVGIDRALEARQQWIEHLSGYEARLNLSGATGALAWQDIDSTLIPGLVAKTLNAGTWNCPTLAIFSKIANSDGQPVDIKRSIRSNRQLLVKSLFDAGSPLLLGTDSGIGQTIPGSSLFDEMTEYLEAGMTPAQVLRITTAEAARFLGEEAEFGNVEAGMRADLLILESNPLDSLDPLSSPLAVIARGKRVR